MLPLYVAFLGYFCIPFYIWSYLQNSRCSQTCQISFIKSSFYSVALMKSCAPNTGSHLCRELDLKLVFPGLAHLVFEFDGSHQPPVLCLSRGGYSLHSLCNGSSKFSAWYVATRILPVVTDRSPSTGKTVQSFKEVKKSDGFFVFSSLALLFRV